MARLKALALLTVCAVPCLAADFEAKIRPLLREHCLDCHSTDKHKGDLDLERFATVAEIRKHPKVWQGVSEQLALGEMPPKEKSRLAPEARERLIGWVNGQLDEVALERAGDPGPVVLRRLSNAEYTFTLQDLTGVPSLDPAREFPTDSASGEGFMNVGNSLVMSPSMVSKYLDAAKDVASHAVLVPDGIRFSPSTSQRDWTEESLAGIRAFYGLFTENGGGTAVNLQGIQFDTKDGGVLPLDRYLEATLELRAAIASGTPVSPERLAAVAAGRKLNAKYLKTLWTALEGTSPSLVLDPIRARWRSARSGDGPALASDIARWQQSLWRFTTIGHIGKRDGPKSWQVPVTPLAESREVRLKLPAGSTNGEVTFFLATLDAGDGSGNDVAVWENPRLVAPGRPELPLRDVRAAVEGLSAHRQAVLTHVVRSLAIAAEAAASPSSTNTEALARRHGLAPAVVSAWFEALGVGAGEVRIDGYMTSKLESAQNHDFIQGWTGADALSVLANASGQEVRVPGTMKAHGVAVHPAPNRRVVVSWRSPVAGSMDVSGRFRHAHPECGNGVAWSVELRRGTTRRRLASGTAQGAEDVPFGPFPRLSIQPGDVVAVVVGPRDGNHSCDLTAVDLTLADGPRTWDLAADVSPDLLAGNPHADRQGNGGVWHFHSEPDNGGGAEPMVPAGSLLARWQSSSDTVERARLAEELQTLLTRGPAGLATNAPDALLHGQLTSLNGPLLRGLLKSATIRDSGSRNPKPPILRRKAAPKAAPGLDPALFGSRPKGSKVGDTSLVVRAPSVIEVRIPAELAAGCEFVATTSLHPVDGAEGSVQMQALLERPASLALAAGKSREQGGKSTWSDGERPVVSDAPILVRNGSAARRRIEASLDEFRQLFPAALCYTKIVPVDEVVTLTLFFREDDHFKRLLLSGSESAELDRLWARLHFVSQDAFKLVDAFEQLWQFATQDADPSAFEPLRKPILQRAEEFRAEWTNAQPRHLESVLEFAAKAYRRPLTAPETHELRALYQRLRGEELPHDQAIRLTLARVLVAPAFLYHAEKAPPGLKPGPVDDWELATRLSYFLWSSTPDAELRALADAGRLHEPEVLVSQTRRMLRDPRVRRLASEFAATWLHLYGFDELSEKSERHFPTFNGLRGAMYEETLRFFTDLFQRNGSVLEILDADHTFLNGELAKHYGIPGVEGPAWRRVDGVKKHSRGGILGQATTLAKFSGASRTSPILRGNWLSEVLLGDKLPKPPKDVPRLPEDEATETLTVRQLTEKHSTDPRCYGCHRRIDPFGFSLEAFDAVGRLRDRDLGGRPIDTRVKVLDGSEFEGADGLRKYLLTQRRDAFLRQFCRKLLGYSLGRGVLLSDGPLVTAMRDGLKSREHHFANAVESIVLSQQFLQVRGQEMPADE
jgi:hypothetical protein